MNDVTLFTAVDRTGDADFYTRFLDEGNQNPNIIRSKSIIVDGLRLRPRMQVLDLGCGPGADVVDLAERMGRTGHVTGVDVSEAMIATARQRTAGLGLPVDFRVGDAQALDFPDETFDAVRSERMLMHVPDAGRALSEMVRVTRRGGRVSIFDFDWDTTMFDSPDRDTTRAIVRAFSDAIKNGWIGRQLPRLLRERGMIDVSHENQTIYPTFPFTELLFGAHLTRVQQAGLLAPPVVERWWQGLAAAHQAGNFLCGFTAFIVSGTRA